MGQQLSYIICKETIDPPIHIIHFKEANTFVFPVLIEENDFIELSETIHKRPDTADEFFEVVLYGGYPLEYPTRRLVEFLKSKYIKSFAFITYNEITGLRTNTALPIVFIDDRLHANTGTMKEEEAHKLLHAEVSFTEIITNEEKYWSYEDAEYYYLNALKNS